MKGHRFRTFFKHIIIYICIAAVLSILLTKYVVSPFRINGHSMFPVLSDKERILISKIAIKKGNINRYDIVVLNKPDNPKKSIIKRVIGLPGEIIEIKNGEIYINKNKIDQPFLKEKKDLTNRSINMKPVVIQGDYYFVMGDNRATSLDSRNFGAVPEKNIYGKAIFRYWPFSKLGTIE